MKAERAKCAIDMATLAWQLDARKRSGEREKG